MIKDYFLRLLDWWKVSVVVDSKETIPFFREGEIWWCNLGVNIGREIFGKGINFTRPVIIFKKINRDSFLAVPLTTKIKNGSWYVEIFYEGIERRAILSQVRVLDGKRLTKKMGTLSRKNFINLKRRFIGFYGF